ncbi:MAG: beta-ketoacyl-ACP synthase III [Desulforegulaceae bacterium]|nr:beta-ketoacyl-ACP synthase III [Desulforegulaceae bacterium]
MRRSVIKGTGRYIPPHLVTNDDLAKIIDTTDEWIQQRTGIKQRYWIEPGSVTGASDLALEASKKAMEKAGWKPEDIDLIIFATLSPDIFFPGSGVFLQNKLGLDSTPALDIRQQCTGFLYGITTADAFIKAGIYDKILVVGAEVHSTGLDKTDRGRDVTVLFGDGAGAACIESLETEEEVGIIGHALHAQGKYAESLMLELPASRYSPERLTKEMMVDGREYPKMDGSRIFKLAVKRLPEVTLELLEKTGYKLENLDMIIPHQANLRINEFYLQKLGLSPEKMYNNIQNYGNTTAGSIPIALDEAIELGKIDDSKDLVLFSALGAGLTWGAVLYKFSK